MAKILMLGRTEAEGHVFGSAEYMAEEMNKLGKGNEYFFAHYLDLAFCLTPEGAAIHDLCNGRELSEYDFVFFREWFKDFRDFAKAISMYLKAKSVPFFNDEALNNRSSSKLSQYVYMAIEGLPLPRTYFAVGPLALEHFEKLSGLSFPIVAKSRKGRRGEANFLVNDAEQLATILEEHPTDQFLMQEFIPNTHDLRVIMYEEKPLLIIKRERPSDSDSHLNNTSQGASASLLPLDYLPKNVIADCYSVSHYFGRNFTGADVIYHPDDNKHWILEVNNMPQLDTGAFVDEKLAALESAIEDVINKG